MKEFSPTARRNCLHQYGCTVEEALALNEGFEFSGDGSPMEKFRAQRWMAEKRGIEWKLTFPEWKGMWDASGKWSERGIGVGQCYMARHGNTGPYSVENAFIAQKVNKTSLRSAGKHDRFAERIGCSLADFASPEQMRLAHRRFNEQRRRARQRGIEWRLTFAEWWGVWKESGLWEQRGRKRGTSAVMARIGDIGAYAKGNVRIVTLAENFAESWISKPNRDCHPNCVRGTGGRFVSSH